MTTGYEAGMYRDIAALRRAAEEIAAALERIATVLEAAPPTVAARPSAAPAASVVTVTPWPPRDQPSRWQERYRPHQPTFHTAADGWIRWTCACGAMSTRDFDSKQGSRLSHTWHVKQQATS